ncbi:MAG: YaiI/YqxD family protein [Pseudomonadota bacterium]
MTILYVDADACPVKAEAERVAGRFGIETVLVCNGGIRPSPNPMVRLVVVDAGPDAADKWIAAACGPGDVVVTADIPLADACVKGGAAVIQPNGEVLTEANIGHRLATRDLMKDIRAADVFHRGGGPAFSKSDRSRFLDGIDRVLRQATAIHR